MRKPDRNPLHSACPILFDLYPPYSELGITLRQADARLRLTEMAEAEETVRRQEQRNAQITDRIARQIADNQLRVQYLIEFGVSSGERESFRHILEQVAQHGGLSLSEAANLAHAQHKAGTEIEAAA